MKNKPKVTVVMPFYNCEKYLDISISSILKQTFSDFEFIVINDASTDRGDSIVKRYIKDKRIIYIKNSTNQGIAQSLNNGISQARGGYVAIMHGDDIAKNNRLAIQYDYMEKHPNISILGSFAEFINDKGRVIYKLKSKPLKAKEIKKVVFRFSPVISPTMFIRHNTFSKIGLFSNSLRRCEDYDFLIRAIFNNLKVNNVHNILLSYRITDSQLSVNQRAEVLAMYSIIKKNKIDFHYYISATDYVIIFTKLAIGIFLPKKLSFLLESLYKNFFYHE